MSEQLTRATDAELAAGLLAALTEASTRARRAAAQTGMRCTITVDNASINGCSISVTAPAPR